MASRGSNISCLHHQIGALYWYCFSSQTFAELAKGTLEKQTSSYVLPGRDNGHAYVTILCAVSWGNKKNLAWYALLCWLVYIVYVVIIVCFIDCACYFKVYF